MDIISEDKIRVIASKHKKELGMTEKDYFLTIFLILIRKSEGFYFKGGTAINKIIFDHIRLSEDLDFTITIPLEKAKQQIENILTKNKKIFLRLNHDKSVYDFTRFLVNYNSYFIKNAKIVLDLNKRANLILKPKNYAVKNYYGMKFTIPCLDEKEIIAEKICALVNRKRPRDYFDVYQLIKHNIPIDIKLVKKKSKSINQEFSVKKIFSKTKKVYNKWEDDLAPFTTDIPQFHIMIKTLKKYFKY